MKPELITAPGFYDLTKKQKKEICNGCGPKGIGWLIPDTMWLLSVRPCCQRHDYGWHKSRTYRELLKHNEDFRTNCLRVVRAGVQWKWLVKMREVRCETYYKAVHVGARAYAGKRGWPLTV